MKRLGLFLLIMAVVVVSAYAIDQRPVTAETVQMRSIYERLPVIYADTPGLNVAADAGDVIHHGQVGNELDQVLGEVLVVGDTYYSSMHNSTIGRMVGFYPGEMTINQVEVEGVTFFAWMDKPDPDDDVHIGFNRAYTSSVGVMTAENTPDGYQVDNAGVAAYTVLAMNSADGVAFPTYHSGGGVETLGAAIAVELAIFPGLFTESSVPSPDGVNTIWPKAAYCEETGIEHIVVSRYNPAEENLAAPNDIYYSQHDYSVTDGQGSFEMGDPVLITDLGRNLAADIAVSNDGDRIAIAQTVSRDYIQYPDDPDAWTQLNQDVYLFTSDDGGDTWNDSVNLTHFIPPDWEDTDSLRGSKDTLRAYADCNVYFDHNDILHVAFTIGVFYERYRTYRPTFSKLYHWDEESDVATQISDGFSGTFVYGVGDWDRTRDRASMYQDPVSGILYCAFHGYGTTLEATPDTTKDRSEAGKQNGEIYITASPPNNELGDWYGRLWAKEVNLTNSEWTGEEAAGIGDCMSEVDPSLSLNNEGDNLHLFYVLDYLGGNAKEDDGGAYTLNDAIWHKVSKSDVLDMFEEQGGWVQNYPLHLDSTQHWEDPYAYDWEGQDWGGEDEANFFRGPVPEVSVDDKNKLQPHEFGLNQNYPNPFNPTTHIGFSLARRGAVKLAVYDVLGREVAELMNRSMSAGKHSITFDGSDLASGIYFVKLSSGTNAHTRKMLLIK